MVCLFNLARHFLGERELREKGMGSWRTHLSRGSSSSPSSPSILIQQYNNLYKNLPGKFINTYFVESIGSVGTPLLRQATKNRFLMVAPLRPYPPPPSLGLKAVGFFLI